MSARGSPEFIHLHNHSEYSFLDGMNRFSDLGGKAPSELLRSLARDGAKAVALTDHGNMYGAVEFFSRCGEAGLKPVIGCELYMARGSRLDRGDGPRSQKGSFHLTALARDMDGYLNLMALSSAGFLEGFHYRPRIDRELLAAHSKGLVVLSGCLKGEVPQLILAGDLDGAAAAAARYRDCLDPGCCYLELMDHGIPEEAAVAKGLLELHKRTGLPLVATNDCHYPRKGDHEAHDALVCIGTGKLLSDADRLEFTSHEFYFKTPAEMHKLLGHAEGALANTLAVAEMCNVELKLGQILLPDYAVPEGSDQSSYLERLAREGLDARGMAGDPRYAQRLSYELSVIGKLGFSGYFLIVWDFIRYAKTNGIPVGPGRGSGAGALVSYALDITTVDPIEHNLLFERFLNPDRRSMPDLDIDFSDDGRQKVIEYVRRKYGDSNVAQIITFNSMAARAAVRDVGRVMAVPLSEVDRLAKLIPQGSTIGKALQSEPDLQELARVPQVNKLLSLAAKLEGIKRNPSIHPAGIVITKEAVVRYSPLSRAGEAKVVTTQYDGEVLPRLGLLKMDFLGLRTLTVIAHATRLIRERGEPGFDIAKIPMDDAKAFELLRAGRCLGVFQLESEGMQNLVRRLKPTAFSDVVALVALYRPGPMGSGMLDDFVARKHSARKVKYAHPLMEPILKDTYGCMVYQEQVMELSKALAGFTPGQADGLRKAMSKKEPAEMEKLRSSFVAGGRKRKIPERLSNDIFDQIVKFGGYGFNKSHSCAYGLVAYQTAYLKANHPLEFMTALATSEIGHNALVEGKENKLVTYLEEARDMGIEVLPPDVLRSQAAFSIEGKAVRFGLLAIKNVGEGAAASIVEARAPGPFAGLDEFCGRVDPLAVNKRVMESLAKAGALDSLLPGLDIHEARARLLAGIEAAMDRQASIKADLDRGQGLLFSATGPGEGGPARAGQAPRAAPLHEHDLLKAEREVLGFYLSGHPILRYRALLKPLATHPIEALKPGMTATVRVAGMLAGIRRMTTKKKGEAWARAVLEDLTGELTLLVFPRAYAEGLGKLLVENAVVTASGRVSFRDESPEPELIVDDILPLERAIERWVRRLVLHVRAAAIDDSGLQELRALLEAHPGPTPVVLRLDTPTHGTAIIELGLGAGLDEPLLKSLDRTLGENAWQIESAS